MLLYCLMEENTLQNQMHYYSHTIITETQTNYATLCLLANSLIQACLKIQQCPLKTKKAIYLTQRCLEMYMFCALVGSPRSPIADYKLSITGLITH